MRYRPGKVRDRSDLLRGAAAGLVAGLLASLAMTGFQAGVAKLFPDVSGGGESSTEKAADSLSEAAVGEPVPDDKKPAAGEAMQYAFGALLGAGYGIAGERVEAIKAGGGTIFGAGAALLFDDIVVPALGLSPPASESPPTTHVYAIASHLVFGLVLEGGRRLLRGR